MKTNAFRFFLACALAVLACASTASGQNVTGTITGEVTDPSGAVMPGANVVAVNLDTNVSTQRDHQQPGAVSHRLSAHRPLPGDGGCGGI